LLTKDDPVDFRVEVSSIGSRSSSSGSTCRFKTPEEEGQKARSRRRKKGRKGRWSSSTHREGRRRAEETNAHDESAFLSLKKPNKSEIVYAHLSILLPRLLVAAKSKRKKGQLVAPLLDKSNLPHALLPLSLVSSRQHSLERMQIRYLEEASLEGFLGNVHRRRFLWGTKRGDGCWKLRTA